MIGQRIRHLATASAMCALIAGCTGSGLTYELVEGEDFGGDVKFALERSIITISKITVAPPTVDSTTRIAVGSLGAEKVDLQARAIPAAADGLYKMKLLQGMGSPAGSLTVRYIPGTRLLHAVEVGAETKAPAAVIPASGPVIAGSASLGFGVYPATPGSRFLVTSEDLQSFEETALDLSDVLSGLDKDQTAYVDSDFGDMNPDFGFSISIDEAPVSAIPTANFFERAAAEPMPVLVRSACRRATLRIYKTGVLEAPPELEIPPQEPAAEAAPVPAEPEAAEGDVTAEALPAPEEAGEPATTQRLIASFRLSIADPNFVETVKMPSSGAVVFHENCGADIGNMMARPASELEGISRAIGSAEGAAQKVDPAGRSADDTEGSSDQPEEEPATTTSSADDEDRPVAAIGPETAVDRAQQAARPQQAAHPVEAKTTTVKSSPDSSQDDAPATEARAPAATQEPGLAQVGTSPAKSSPAKTFSWPF